jgi:hypothetical protein
MAENKKMTKKDYFAELRELVIDRTDLVEFIDHEIELLTRKASKSGQTKTQKENETIMDKIVVALKEIGRPVTITELQGANDEMAQFSNQKLSALLKKLVDTDVIVKTVDKKKSYFSVNE